MMIDASALVAILLREPDAAELVMAIADAKAPFTSPIAVYETVVLSCASTHGVRRKRRPQCGNFSTPHPSACARLPTA